MNLVVTGAQPGEQPGKAGAALPGGGATARDPKCFFDSRYDEDVILLLRGAGPSVQNFDKSGTTNLCFFFCCLVARRLQLEVFAEDSGYDRTTFQHRGANVPSDEL